MITTRLNAGETGDNYGKDVVGAKGAGMRAVWVKTPPPQNLDFIVGSTPGPAEGESVADGEIGSIAELPDWIASLEAQAL